MVTLIAARVVTPDDHQFRRAQSSTLFSPERTFAAILHEKIYGPPLAEPTEAAPRDAGAIDPHLGLSPGQNSDMLVRGKGHRSGRVIVKG